MYMIRHVGRVDYASATTVPLQLPREHFYNRLFLQFTLGDQVATNTYVMNSQRLMADRIEIIANGQLVLKSFPQYVKYLHNWHEYGSTAYEVGAGVAASVVPRRCDILIEFGINTADITCLLPSHLLSSLELRITWIAVGTITAAGTLVQNLMYCDVYALELINQGQDAKSAIMNKETMMYKYPTAVAFAEFEMPLGNVYRELFLTTEGGAVAKYQNETVTDIELVQDGVAYHRKYNYLTVLSENMIESAGLIDQDVAQPIGAANAMAAAASIPAGNCLIQLDYQNYNAGGSSNPVALIRALPHLPDSSKMASWKLRCYVPDVTETVQLSLLMRELILPKQRA